jgi:isoquinoline 1-oxidoreductase beta subunit
MRRIQEKAVKPSRRSFLIGSAAAVGGGFVVGFFSPIRGSLAQTAPAAATPLEAYLRIGSDGTVTVLSAHMEGGQGCDTGIATLVADELDADWSQMRVVGGAGNPQAYGNLAWGGAAQGTGGSTAMVSSWDRYRRAGAAARTMLLAAAAQQWGVSAAEIAIEKGVLSHPSGRRATFGELAAAAAKMPAPGEPKLKDAKGWVHIGNPKLRRFDTAAKTTGKHPYTIDVALPGMLTAVLARPPLFGAKVKSFDPASAKTVAGVVEVVETPRGVAVVARDTWSAIKGRDALKVEWDDSAAEKRGTAELLAKYRELAANGTAAVARNEGDAGKALAGAAKTMEAAFDFPYLAHAAMEPLNAVARLENGTLEIWGGHQIPDLYQYTAAQIVGLPPEKVKLHVLPTGGFFGRRATPDSDVIVEVASIVKAMGGSAPVKVQWTREDDMAGGRYRPLYHHRVQTGLDAQGNLTGWKHRIVGQSILKGTPFESALVQNGIDGTSVEGASTLAYAVPNLLVELVTTEVGVPVLWWRSVGHTHTAYAVETVIDDLAHAAGKDPVEFRRALLKHQPRHLAVLNLAAEKAGWGSPLPAGRGRGVAVHKSFDTYVAEVAEVTVIDGRVKVDRVVCAVDCGIAINPDVIAAQMEGGIGFGLGAALHGAITLDGGAVQQTNFDTYQCLRIDEMPRVEVHIVPSTERPTGVGEPGVPPIAPAVANAVFAATGQRVRSLPFGEQKLS